MKPRYLVPLVTLGFISPLVFAPTPALAQQSLTSTTLGKSQNSSQDLVNSLVPGPQKYGKGEKKSEVDTKTLQSKKTNDKTFSGSLDDIGMDWNGAKMGKPPAATASDAKVAKNGEATTGGKESKPAKEADASHEKDSKVSNSTFDLESTNLQLPSSNSELPSEPSPAAPKPSAAAQSKDRQQTTPAAAAEKPAEKAAATKPDGDH